MARLVASGVVEIRYRRLSLLVIVLPMELSSGVVLLVLVFAASASRSESVGIRATSVVGDASIMVMSSESEVGGEAGSDSLS